MRILKKLLSTKMTVVAVAVTLVVAAVLALVFGEIGRWLAVALIVLVGAVGFLLHLAWNRRQLAKLRGDLQDARAQLQEIGGSANRTVSEEEFYELARLVVRVRDGEPVSDEEIVETFSRSAFDPNLVFANTLVSRPDAHSAGRMAAAQDMRGDNELKLRTLTATENVAAVSHIGFVGGSELDRALDACGTVTTLRPGLGIEQLRRGTSFLVIDERALEGSPWAGVLDVRETVKFEELTKLVKLARGRRIIVVTIAADVPSHFTSEFHQAVDVVVENGDVEFLWGQASDLDHPILNAVIASAQESTR